MNSFPCNQESPIGPPRGSHDLSDVPSYILNKLILKYELLLLKGTTYQGTFLPTDAMLDENSIENKWNSRDTA